MMWRMIVPALASVAFLHGAAWAQSTATDDINQTLPQKIRDELTAQGFKDVKVTAGSYVVSAKDKDGADVVMVIGPNQTTMLKRPSNPSQAQLPDVGKDEIIQQ
jgi:hypothetical protein